MAEMQAYLTLIGNNLDFEEITSAMGMPPAEIRRRNEILGNGRAFGHDEWGIETDVAETLDLDDIMSLLMDKLSNCSPEKLRSIADTSNAEWHLLFYVHAEIDNFPALGFSKDQVSFLGAAGVNIGFDVYVVD